MNFPGLGGGGGDAPQGYDANDPNIKRIQGFTESCYGKTAMAGVAGFGLGALFGMFMASMAYDTPFHTPMANGPVGAGPATATTTAALSRHPRLPPYTTGLPRPVTGVGAAAAAAMPAAVASLPLRQQVAHGFRDMGARGYSTAKSFAKVGALFSGIECGIEGLRAKNDLANGVAAGCLTGAILARAGGPGAAAFGCAGFAAFSAAIDTWLRQPKDE